VSGDSARRAVAVGGGTGLPTVLRCLLASGFETTAVVAVADDGGSSGRLREALGMLPPGDIRNCLVALAAPGNELARVFQYRFPSGEGLEGHALGNLVIAALADLEGGFPAGVEAAGRLLGARGAVLPSTLSDVLLYAEDADGRYTVGQARVAHGPRPPMRVHLEPASPAADPRAIEAVLEADAVVIGPGSLYTSLVPNLLVAGIADALRDTRAAVVYVCNVANQRGETKGMDAADHVDALFAHGLARLDVAIVHDGPAGEDLEAVAADVSARERIAARGARVVAADLADPADPRRHAADRLGAVLSEVL